MKTKIYSICIGIVLVCFVGHTIGMETVTYKSKPTPTHTTHIKLIPKTLTY